MNSRLSAALRDRYVPENIFLPDPGHAVVGDFGLALAQSAAGSRPTAAGTGVGSAHCMGPEQAAGDPDLDARSDVYALARVLYEMLTGDSPFRGDSFHAVLAAHRLEQPSSIRTLRPDLPPELAATVHRALSKRRSDRPQTAAEFRTLLSVEAAPSSMLRPAISPRSAAWAASVALIIAVVLVSTKQGVIRLPIFGPQADTSRYVVVPVTVAGSDAAMHEDWLLHHNLDPPGSARWGWLDNDENVWVRCGSACCEITEGRLEEL